MGYAEILVAVSVVAIALVPAIEALQTELVVSRGYEESVIAHYHLTARVEDLLATPYDPLEAEAVATGDMTAATSYSDDVGAPNRRLVYLSNYDGDDADEDGDPFTGTDAGLLWIRVALETNGKSIDVLRHRSLD